MRIAPILRVLWLPGTVMVLALFCAVFGSWFYYLLVLVFLGFIARAVAKSEGWFK